MLKQKKKIPFKYSLEESRGGGSLRNSCFALVSSENKSFKNIM